MEALAEYLKVFSEPNRLAVLQALRDIALGAGLDWASVAKELKQQGRLQLETY